MKFLFSILIFGILTGCGQGTTFLSGTKCVAGVGYWISDQNIATLLVDSKSHPIQCDSDNHLVIPGGH